MCVVAEPRADDVRSSHQFEGEIGPASSDNGLFIAKMQFSVRTGGSVMNKVLDVHSQHFVHELIRIRSRTQPAPTALLDDGARAIANDGVAASLQRQQERGLTCPGAACDHYSRHAEVPSPVFCA
jgi:hypothetical protein